MIKLEFVVWEFVRLMVELEDDGDYGRDAGAYSAWRDSWQEVDARLTKLGGRDANAFAELMMDQTVTVPCRSSRQLVEAIDALTRVTAEIKKEIKQARRKPEARAELEFELVELGNLIDRLRGIDRTVLTGD